MLLLLRVHGSVFFRGGDAERPLIFGPVAIGGVMELVMLRPHKLWHAGDHAEDKTKKAIQARTAKQAAVTAFMHDDKCAQRPQTHQGHQCRGEPQRNGA